MRTKKRDCPIKQRLFLKWMVLFILNFTLINYEKLNLIHYISILKDYTSFLKLKYIHASLVLGFWQEFLK